MRENEQEETENKEGKENGMVRENLALDGAGVPLEHVLWGRLEEDEQPGDIQAVLGDHVLAECVVSFSLCACLGVHAPGKREHAARTYTLTTTHKKSTAPPLTHACAIKKECKQK